MKFKNYRNSYNNSNRIYSNKEVRNMRLSEIAKIQDELRAQYKAIGVPTSEALRASSNVIWIDEYTRDDGTKVSGHWRSLPDDRSDEGFLDENTVSAERNNSSKGTEMSEYIKQENEKSVLRKDPESIAGVKRGTPMSFEEAATEKINPAYFQDDYQEGYTNNCQSCALAYEARRRGYDVQSVSCEVTSKAEELSYTTFGAWLDSDSKPCNGEVLNADNAEALYNQLDNTVKQGERYAIITYLVRDTDEGCMQEGHIEILDRDKKDNLRLYDPQCNGTRQEDCIIGHLEAYADFTGRQPTLILRVDDKRFNPYYLDGGVRGVGR